MATHVPLLHDESLQIQLEREVAVVLAIDSEHGLHKDDAVAVVDVEVHGSLARLRQLLLLVCLLRLHIYANVDRTFVRATIVELEVNLHVLLALLLLISRRYILLHLTGRPELVHICLAVGTLSAITLLGSLELLTEHKIRVIVVLAVPHVNIEIVDAHGLIVFS